ncbi:MAG: hypothetical protein AAF700_09960 [Pseudomonadota bacterium]
MISPDELLFLLQSTLIQAVVYTLLASFVLLLAFRFYLRVKEMDYDRAERRARLGAIRTSKEGRIYDLVDDLTASDKRWKEVNHLALDSAPTIEETRELISLGANNKAVNPTLFLERMGIDLNEISVKQHQVFYLTPFHEDFEETYDTVRSAADKIGLKLTRGDEDFATGPITRQIIRNIVQAHFIVANLDGRNPNVFYELGFANAIGKPVIMIANRKTSVPFDISVDRTLLWHDQNDLAAELTQVLARLAIKNS